MKLFAHQIAGVDFILNKTPERGCGALFHEMGLGKTIAGLSIFKELRRDTPQLKMLVICPISLIEGAWAEDIQKFDPTLKFHNLYRKPKITGAPDILVTNYESMRSADKIKTVRDLARSTPFLCVLDESSKIKNHSAMTTKSLIAMSEIFKYRVIATGTPAPNSEQEYWAQMQFIKKGIFHASFFAFRNTYFYLKNRYTGAAMPQGMKLPYGMAQDILRKCDYTMTDERRADLFKEIGEWAHFAKKSECLDLPETLDEVRKIYMSAPQRAAYKQMKQHLILELKDSTITAQVALTKILKLRQITSGFVYNENHEAIEIN